MYQPTGTPGTPIRAPKQQYLPPEQAHLLGPLSKRVKTSNCLSKLQNEPLFFLSPSHHWQGAMYWPTGTLGTPIRNQKKQYYPWNKPIFLSCFPRGQRPGILSQNCQMNHFFFSTHLTPGKGPCIGQLGPLGLHQSPQTTIFTHRTSPFSLAAFWEGKDQ